MLIKSLKPDLAEKIRSYGLSNKWEKVSQLFIVNHRHPSLHTELLEPRWRGIYSFRLDRKYRALFFIARGEAEIFAITKHYRKS